jgi:hypothetical protein
MKQPIEIWWHRRPAGLCPSLEGRHRSASYAILSVGGFLGMGTHLVAVPFDSLQISSKQVTLLNATKDSLLALPEFKYAPD